MAPLSLVPCRRTGKVTDCRLICGKGPRNRTGGLPVHLDSASPKSLVAKAVGQMLHESSQTGEGVGDHGRKLLPQLKTAAGNGNQECSWITAIEVLRPAKHDRRRKLVSKTDGTRLRGQGRTSEFSRLPVLSRVHKKDCVRLTDEVDHLRQELMTRSDFHVV